jgi:putative membrane protein
MRTHNLLIAGLLTGVAFAAPSFVLAADNSVSIQDQTFATDARQGNQAEIIMSQNVEDRTRNTDIKAFAKKMISDHTYLDEQLKKAAEGTDASLPDNFDGPHQAMVDRVSNASDADVDRDYLMVQDKAHKEAIAAYRAEAAAGTNDRLKSLAAQSVPVLQDHLAMLMKLEQSPKFASMMPATAAGSPETTTTITTTTTTP